MATLRVKGSPAHLIVQAWSDEECGQRNEALRNQLCQIQAQQIIEFLSVNLPEITKRRIKLIVQNDNFFF